jgi:surface protein
MIFSRCIPFIVLVGMNLWPTVTAECLFTPANRTELRTAIEERRWTGSDNYGPIGDWCVQNVTDFWGLFSWNAFFNEDINDWQTGQVTTMEGMFSFASYFNQPLNNWNVSSVQSMKHMFHHAYEFNQPLNNWNVSSVTSMESMFNGPPITKDPRAVSFNQPLNDWNVSSVLSMTSMFTGAFNFNQPLDNWNVSSVTSMGGMFSGASSFNQSLCTWAKQLRGKEVETVNMFGNTQCSSTTPNPNLQVGTSFCQACPPFSECLDGWIQMSRRIFVCRKRCVRQRDAWLPWLVGWRAGNKCK